VIQKRVSTKKIAAVVLFVSHCSELTFAEFVNDMTTKSVLSVPPGSESLP
jgi:hypothetical protein